MPRKRVIFIEKKHFLFTAQRSTSQRNCSNVIINRWIACAVLCCAVLRRQFQLKSSSSSVYLSEACANWHMYSVHTESMLNVTWLFGGFQRVVHNSIFVYKHTKDRIESVAQHSMCTVQCQSCDALSLSLSLLLSAVASEHSAVAHQLNGSHNITGLPLFCSSVEICCVRLSQHAVYVFPFEAFISSRAKQ